MLIVCPPLLEQNYSSKVEPLVTQLVADLRGTPDKAVLSAHSELLLLLSISYRLRNLSDVEHLVRSVLGSDAQVWYFLRRLLFSCLA